MAVAPTLSPSGAATAGVAGDPWTKGGEEAAPMTAATGPLLAMVTGGEGEGAATEATAAGALATAAATVGVGGRPGPVPLPHAAAPTAAAALPPLHVPPVPQEGGQSPAAPAPPRARTPAGGPPAAATPAPAPPRRPAAVDTGGRRAQSTAAGAAALAPLHPMGPGAMPRLGTTKTRGATQQRRTGQVRVPPRARGWRQGSRQRRPRGTRSY